VNTPDRLRVALLAGTLGQGGAEKQLAYIVRTLLQAGADTRVYSLTRGEFYEGVLESYGVRPHWAGASSNPIVRLAVLTRQVGAFRPHVIHSQHTFTNLYAAFIGKALRAVSIGSLQSILAHSQAANGWWTRWLLRSPDALVVNSRTAFREVQEEGLVRAESVYLLRNVIEQFPGVAAPSQTGIENSSGSKRRAIFVGRLVPAKRLDRFLRALARARQQEPSLEGLIVGDGRCRGEMEQLARQLGLATGGVTFVGRRDDVPQLLTSADMLVLCSDREGLPNVVLEAMAAGLPVITTPAGDAGIVVDDGATGYVVSFDDIDAMASRMVALARSAELRGRLGAAGLRKVTQQFGFEGLLGQLMTAYHGAAARTGHRGLLKALGTTAGVA
jgi:glycosyltransferase involved in cell wall biosynthesis